MPGFALGGGLGLKSYSDSGLPLQAFPLGKSITLYPGDPVVLTTAAAKTTSSTPVVVPLANAHQIAGAATAYGASAIQEDASGNDIASAQVIGILGFATSAVVTNGSGVGYARPAPPGVSSGVQPIYSIPSVAYGYPLWPTIGHSQDRIALASDDLLVWGGLWEATAVTTALIGRRVGIRISTINSIPSYFWILTPSEAGPDDGGLVGVIERVELNHELYNVAASTNVLNTTHNPRCPVAVRILPQLRQSDTGQAAYTV